MTLTYGVYVYLTIAALAGAAKKTINSIIIRTMDICQIVFLSFLNFTIITSSPC